MARILRAKMPRARLLSKITYKNDMRAARKCAELGAWLRRGQAEVEGGAGLGWGQGSPKTHSGGALKKYQAPRFASPTHFGVRFGADFGAKNRASN